MSEFQYPGRYCAFCGAKVTERSLHCEKCGMRITRSIIEYQSPLHPWPPLTSLLVTLLAYGAMLFSGVTLFFYYIVYFGIPPLNIITIDQDPFFIILSLIAEFNLLLIPLGFIWRLKPSRSRVGLTSGGSSTLLKDFILGIGAGIAMTLITLGLIIYQILSSGFGPPPVPPGPTELFWLVIICVAMWLVVAPVEEFLFRGFLQNTLDAHYGNIAGVLTASVIFGLAHLNPLIGITQTISGIVLGLLFQWRGRRLAGPIAAHATFNCIIILLETFFI